MHVLVATQMQQVQARECKCAQGAVEGEFHLNLENPLRETLGDLPIASS